MNNIFLHNSLKAKDELFKIYNRPTNDIEYWHISDTDVLFEYNKKKYSNSPHIKNYIDNPIEYRYNNYGMRTNDEFSLEGDGNVFLGCSHTFGIGHYLENTWSYKLHKKIGGKFYNISEPGSGIDIQYEYLKYFKNKIKFKNLFHFFPDECFVRFDERIVSHFPNYDELKNVVYMYFNFINNLCDEIGVNYYLITKSFHDVANINPFHENLTPARDLRHYYVEEHDEIVDLFYTKFLNKETYKSKYVKLNQLRKLI